jgi:LytS/YehU family sensor histidine kinase
MKSDMKDIQKVGFVVILVNIVFMLTIIITVNHQIQAVDKLTKTDLCMLWFNGISKTMTMSGLTFEQMIPEGVLAAFKDNDRLL